MRPGPAPGSSRSDARSRPVRVAALRAPVLTVLALLATGAFASPDCPTERFDEHAPLARVIDGDTVVLDDGRHVRLVGLDTPEIGRDGAPSDPLAEAARDALLRLAAVGTRIGLRHDAERHDRHGRTLAHAFLGDGTNLQSTLLDAGLATALVVPPRAWGIDCYARAESAARAARRGLWRLERYQPREAETLDPRARGFHIVRGRVSRIGRGGKNLWLQLATNVAVRIPFADLPAFEPSPERLLDRRVEVRGWIQRRRGELRITVRHPAALAAVP